MLPYVPAPFVVTAEDDDEIPEFGDLDEAYLADELDLTDGDATTPRLAADIPVQAVTIAQIDERPAVVVPVEAGLPASTGR
jgi:hypothetical protein